MARISSGFFSIISVTSEGMDGAEQKDHGLPALHLPQGGAGDLGAGDRTAGNRFGVGLNFGTGRGDEGKGRSHKGPEKGHGASETGEGRFRHGRRYTDLVRSVDCAEG
ncbi:hypothetical protein E4T56_gene14212 [Termitomyces sp. T112]|nr:hypothetical protein E4T56_gene14212 [Termitomyces sp. T112]